jgi:hypothetical protein
LVVARGGAVRGENAQWAGLATAFGEQFKVKTGVSLKQKQSAVNALAKSNDGRAVDLLISVVDDQERYAAKLLQEWADGEAEFQKESAAMDERIQKAQREGWANGSDHPEYPHDVKEWMGRRMMAWKEKLKVRFEIAGEEQGLAANILRAVSRVLNSLDGEELQRATTRAATAATAAKKPRRLLFVKAFGYAKGEGVTAFLETVARDTDSDLVQTALEAIGRQNSVRGPDILIPRLDDARWQVRAAAITGLSFTRNAASVGKVMDALLERGKKEEGVLQRNFFVGMARIIQESIPATIEAWESWWKANREEFLGKLADRPEALLPIEDDPEDPLVETNQGSSSFYGITTNSKHIIYVVDVSGSMRADVTKAGVERAEPGEKARIEVAREELKNALRGLTSREGDERGGASFNIVVFATDVEVYKPGKMIEATKAAKEAAFKWIDERVVPTYATNIYDALEQAFNIISATTDTRNLKSGADTIFLMTDGEPNRGKFFDKDLIVSEVKRLNATRKITLHTIGVGEGHSADFLRKLAAANGGQYIGR